MGGTLRAEGYSPTEDKLGVGVPAAQFRVIVNGRCESDVLPIHPPEREVFVPCPHYCGEQGADFKLRDAQCCQTMTRNNLEVGVLAKPGESYPGNQLQGSESQ